MNKRSFFKWNKFETIMEKIMEGVRAGIVDGGAEQIQYTINPPHTHTPLIPSGYIAEFDEGIESIPGWKLYRESSLPKNMGYIRTNLFIKE